MTRRIRPSRAPLFGCDRELEAGRTAGPRLWKKVARHGNSAGAGVVEEVRQCEHFDAWSAAHGRASLAR